MGTAVNILKIVAGSLEALLGFPVLGGTIVIGTAYVALAVMFCFHIINLVLAVKAGKTKAGSILGIVTSCVAFIPFVGMTMHILTAIFLLIEGIKRK